MTDLTAPLIELRAAYRAYQSAKREKKEEIRERYETRIAEETRVALEAEKYAFAKLLRDRKEDYGLKVTEIQDYVLRTRNWKVWEELRDYADILPEQVIREDNRKARRLENARWIWDLDAGTFTVRKGPHDQEINPPVVYRIDTFRLGGPRRDMWMGDSQDDDYEMEVWRSNPGFSTMVSAEIKRAKEAGEIE